jgi:kynurenine formamidase
MPEVHARLSRRSFFTGAGAAAAAGAASMVAPAGPARAASGSFERVVDMTHTLDPAFPTYFNRPGIAKERMAEFGADGFNMFSWNLIEHAGTHLDAPIHFSEDGQTADQVPAEALVVGAPKVRDASGGPSRVFALV